MENNKLTDSELSSFFQKRKQLEKHDPIFTWRVIKRLPPYIPVKYVSSMIFMTCAAAILLIFGLKFDIFLHEITMLLVDHHIHSEQILVLFVVLISTFTFLLLQAIKTLNE